MASTALALTVFLAANATIPNEERAPAPAVEPVRVAEVPPASPPARRRKSPALFGTGIAVASVGVVGFAAGVGLLMASSESYSYGTYSDAKPEYKTPGLALTIAGPLLAAGGITMAIVGGRREGAAVPPPDEKNTRRQSPALFGVGMGATIAGSVAVWSGLGLLSLSSSASTEDARRFGGPLALGGALLTGMGLTMAIVGGKRVHADEVAVVPIVDSKTAGAAAIVRF